MAGALASGLMGSGSNPGRGHYIVILDKTRYSHIYYLLSIIRYSKFNRVVLIDDQFKCLPGLILAFFNTPSLKSELFTIAATYK